MIEKNIVIYTCHCNGRCGQHIVKQPNGTLVLHGVAHEPEVIFSVGLFINGRWSVLPAAYAAITKHAPHLLKDNLAIKGEM